MNKNYRKMAEAPKLADILSGYNGKIVRIGTDGSAYYVCGAWSDELKADLEWWETKKCNDKAANIDKMKNCLVEDRKNLPKMKKKLPKLETELEETSRKKDEFIQIVNQSEALRNERLTNLPMLVTRYLDKKAEEMEESIKDLPKKDQKKARKDFLKYAKGRRTIYSARLRKYVRYINTQRLIDEKKLTGLINAEEVARNRIDDAKKRIGNMKARLEVYPSKIRDYKKYLETYNPFLNRDIMEIYESEIHPGETSIIIRGREQGPFWDCSEFNRWKKSGVLQRD